ncbi:MAG: hypothetical protein WBP45_12735, partial [Daejeonella sp.]
MKYLSICLFFIFTSVNLYAGNNDEIKAIKSGLVRAVQSSKATDSLYTKLVSKKSEDALIIAYIGTLEALKAKHAWNPYNKIKFVAQSQSTMKTAIKKDADNLEIRFMRFSIQHFTPAFLGYSKELAEDQKAIVNHFVTKSFGNADKLLIKSIADFMLKSKRCSASEV